MNLFNRQRDNNLTQSRVEFCNIGLVCLVCHKCVRYSSLRDQLKDDQYTQSLWSDVPIIQTFQVKAMKVNRNFVQRMLR